MSVGDWDEHLHAPEASEPDADAELEAAIWSLDNVELTTVGIDVGSATSHLLFSRLHLRRRAEGYSSRFVVVGRTTLYRSQILLTPYLSDGLIDASALGAFIHGAYRDAAIAREDVDAGAVILTGVALERANARPIAELFAEEGGRFVCASAGHSMEALLAAHGSGAVEQSAEGTTVLNIDVGGGTTKLALCRAGAIVATMAVWGGSRLVVLDSSGRLERVEPAMLDLAGVIGLRLAVGDPLDAEARHALAEAIAQRVFAAVRGVVPADQVLAGELPTDAQPDRVVFSGGVAEYLEGDGPSSATDLGRELAAALSRHADELGLIRGTARERIRATVIGASQFSLQLSGNTIHLSGSIALPIHNVPVVAIDLTSSPEWAPDRIRASIERRTAQLDLTDREDPIGVALNWIGEPLYARLRALAEGIASAHLASARRDAPLIVVLEADIGASLGAILRSEIGLPGGLIAIDGIELSDLDFVDIGELIWPANVVPVVIKSLIFPHGAERPRILGSS